MQEEARIVNRIHEAGMFGNSPNPERIRTLLSHLGEPQRGLRYIHVAGTNGKGSVCAMLDAILRRAGLCTGLFTSPYIRRFEERIRVNGECIPEGELAEIGERVLAVADQMEDRPTEFELVTAIGDEPAFETGLAQSIAAVPGKWGSLLSLSSGGVCLEWWRRNLTVDADGSQGTQDGGDHHGAAPGVSCA